MAACTPISPFTERLKWIPADSYKHVGRTDHGAFCLPPSLSPNIFKNLLCAGQRMLAKTLCFLPHSLILPVSSRGNSCSSCSGCQFPCLWPIALLGLQNEVQSLQSGIWGPILSMQSVLPQDSQNESHTPTKSI